jgi:hypothetical protein
MGINFAQRGTAVSKISLQTFDNAGAVKAPPVPHPSFLPVGLLAPLAGRAGGGARRLGRRPEGVSIAAAPSQVSSDGRRLNQHRCFFASSLLRAAPKQARRCSSFTFDLCTLAQIHSLACNFVCGFILCY